MMEVAADVHTPRHACIAVQWSIARRQQRLHVVSTNSERTAHAGLALTLISLYQLAADVRHIAGTVETLRTNNIGMDWTREWKTNRGHGTCSFSCISDTRESFIGRQTAVNLMNLTQRRRSQSYYATVSGYRCDVR